MKALNVISSAQQPSSELAYLLTMMDPKTRANSSIGFERWPTAKTSIFTGFASLKRSLLPEASRNQLVGRLHFDLNVTADTAPSREQIQSPRPKDSLRRDWGRESILQLLQQNHSFSEPPKILYRQPRKTVRSTEMVAFDPLMLLLLDRSHLLALCRHYGLPYEDHQSKGSLEETLLTAFKEHPCHRIVSFDQPPVNIDEDGLYKFYTDARKRAIKAVSAIIGPDMSMALSSEYPQVIWQFIASHCGIAPSSAKLRWMLRRRDELDLLF